MGNGIDSSVKGYHSFDPDLLSSELPTWLMSGDKWGNSALGQAVNLTFSFSSASSSYKSGYGNDQDSGVFALNAEQKAAATAVLDAYSAIADLTFTKVTETSTLAGDIRFANTSSSNVGTAEAYYPSSAAEGGDVWFGTVYGEYYQHPVAGDYGYYTFLHEFGHALGLQHPHEDVATPSARDSIKFTVMSYRSYAGGPLQLLGDYYPTTPMVDDILAIQTLYGENRAYHSGNDTYSWGSNQKIFETIWDGAGTDTIDASNQALGVTLKLTAGAYSSIGQSFSDGNANVRNCLGIAYNCTIENASGSSHDDIILGNTSNNLLRGNAGSDVLAGGNGNDRLTGGADIDKFRFNTALNQSSNVDTINDFSLPEDVIQLDNVVFKKLLNTGTLQAGNFRASTSGNAVDSNDYIVYDTDSGKLFYDADGNGAGAKLQFALIGTTTHAALTATDIVVI